MLDLDGVTLGIDIGGTKIAAGVVDTQGVIRLTSRTPMVTTGDAMVGLDCVVRAIEGVLAACGRADIRAHILERGIGVCAPGPLDPRRGIVVNPPHVPCWRNFPLAEHLQQVFGVPVRVDNDANAAGLAEAIWGSGSDSGNLFYVTFGTGVGTGIILDRQIYHGRTGAAGEGGHTTIDYRGPQCSCGKRGCLDVLCSGSGIAKRAREKVLSSGGRGLILELAGGAENIQAEHVGQAYQMGDPLAEAVLTENADLVVVWLGNMIDLLDPEAIVVGGGVADLIAPFFGYIVKQLPQWTLNARVQEIPLLGAHYGAEAGIAGAAALMAENT